MVVGSLSQEVKCLVAPARLWKAAIVDINKLLPKIAPQFISSIEMIEGAGSVFLTTFTQAIKGVKAVKSCTDTLEEANFCYKYTVFEGNLAVFETVSYEYKFEAGEDGGSLCKVSMEYKTLGDVEPTEEEKGEGAKTAVRTLRGIEAYLLACPDAYAQFLVLLLEVSLVL